MDKIVLTTAKRRGSDLCSEAADCDLEVAICIFSLFKEKTGGCVDGHFSPIKFLQTKSAFFGVGFFFPFFLFVLKRA